MDKMGETSRSWHLPEGKPFGIIKHGAKLLPSSMVLNLHIEKEQFPPK